MLICPADLKGPNLYLHGDHLTWGYNVRFTSSGPSIKEFYEFCKWQIKNEDE